MKNIFAFLLCALSVAPAFGQGQTGFYANGSFDNFGFDSVDRGSLNVHFAIPVVNKQGRGMSFQYQLVYDGLVWTPSSAQGPLTWSAASDFGLHGQLNEGYQGYLSYSSQTYKCYQGSSYTYQPITSAYVYHDAFGGEHPFNYTFNVCTNTASGAGPSPDGSGYSYYGGASVTAIDGTQISAPLNSQTASGSNTDRNGNVINNNGNGTFTDTLGKTALTITGSGTVSSPRVYTYNTPTGTAAVTVTYKSYQVQTKFGCSAGEFDLPETLVDRVTLADGSFYQFGYEVTPTVSTSVTGRLASLTLPQGGVISYTYTGANNGIVCADGTPTGLKRVGAFTRTYVRSSITATSGHIDITDGFSNDLAMDFVLAGIPETFYETNRVLHINAPNGSTLATQQTCYGGNQGSCTTAAITQPVMQVDTYSGLAGGYFDGSTFTYNTYGLKTGQTDYDFGSGTARGPALRKETWVYPTSGILNLVSSDTVTDGTNQIGSTTYAYDETTGTGHAALATTSVPQHVPNAGQRGNLTTLTQSSAPSGSNTTLTTYVKYEDTGNPISVLAPTGTSTYAYDTAAHAFPITLTPQTPSSGISLLFSATNDSNSGLPSTVTDPNNTVLTYATYDSLNRPTELDYTGGGVTVGKANASYTDTLIGVYNYMNASTHTNTQTNFDNFGRLNYVAQQNASGGYYWNDYCYDANGNLSFSAYRSTSENTSCSGAGDSFTYDALGRILTITHSDSSKISYSYNGSATQITDENGVSRVVQVDGLGRTTAVCEITVTPMAGVAPSNCGLQITSASGFKTTYAYTTDTTNSNALLITASQGPQMRYFEFDWLSRTTSVIEPESGTTSYTYTYSSTPGLGLKVKRTRPQANKPKGSGTFTTDTNTQYDSLNRLVSTTYTDGTTPQSYYYDVNNYRTTQTANNIKGRLVVTSGGTGATASSDLFSYDAMGRVANMWSCGPATCGTSSQSSRPMSFAWDWAGNLTSETSGAAGTINYGRSIAGEVTSITNASYTNLPYNPPNLVSNVANGPDGPISYTLGNGLNVYQSYDQLGRNSGKWLCNGPAAQACSGGTQVYGTSSQWKGTQMQYQSDTLLNQQITYGYGDGFNRLTSRTVTAGTAQNYTYSYDRYGNRSQTALNGGYNFTPTYSATTNQITSGTYTYDLAGNMTNDSASAYAYDAEGNITQVMGTVNGVATTTTYVYDAFNRRVHTQIGSVANEFTYDYAGRRVSTWLSPNNYGDEGRIYWDGQQVAYRSTDGTTYFEHQDTLGTERMRTNYAGSVGSSYLSLPFGDGYTATVNSSGADQDNEHFAGLEHDAESGTEHAQFRNYGSSQGRWLAPDSYLGSYALSNPQSMNRYAYALNNPMSFVDPSGLTPYCTVVSGSLRCYDNEGNNNQDCAGDFAVCVMAPIDCVAYGTEGCATASNPGSGPTQPTSSNPGGSNGGSSTSAPSNVNKILQCASTVANQFSIAGVLGVNEETHPVLAAFSNAFLGNTFSGISDTITHVASGSFGAAYGDFALGGTAQGLPIGSTASSKGLAGVITEAGVNAVTGPGAVLSGVTGVATQLGEEGLAGPVGLAKLGIDGAVYLGALAYCRAHP